MQAGKTGDQREAEGWEKPLTANDEGWVRPPRVARCRWRSSDIVQLFSNDEGSAHLLGVTQCASISGCPVCSAVLRHKRSADIQAAAEAWGTPPVKFEAEDEPAAADRYLLFTTLTTRHSRTDPIEKGIDAVANGWRILTRTKWWAAFKAKHGIVGFIRSLEFTWTENAGWHAHLHILIFAEGTRPTPREVTGTMSDDLLAHWQLAAVKAGGGKPTRKGFDMQLVDGNGAVLAQYLGKVQEKPVRKGIGAEMGRADYKTGNGRTSWTPFDLLDLTDDDQLTARNGHLYVEYHRGTLGRRVITWSKGLRDLTGALEPEKSDEEEMEEARSRPLYTFDSGAYDRLQNRPLTLAEVMDHAAYGEVDQIAAIAVPLWQTTSAAPDDRIEDLKRQYAEGQERRAAAELLNPPHIWTDADDF